MSTIHSTGSRSNVYRIGDSTKPLKSRKPRNPFRTWVEKFCKFPPDSRLRILKALLAEHRAETKVSGNPQPEPPSRPDAAFFLKNGISRALWERYEQAQHEAWRLEWQEKAP